MVTVGSSWTPPEEYFKGDDGTYPVTLVRIGVEDRQGAFTPGATRTYEGQFGEKTVQDWRFALEDGSVIDAAITAPRDKDGDEVIHPKSTYYQYVVALAGKDLDEGTKFDPQTQLIGRMGLARIARDDRGYPRIKSLSSMPTALAAAQPVAPAAPAPIAAPVAQPVAASPVAPAADPLPF